MVKVECIVEYDDVLLKERIPVGKQFDVTNDRADYLANERKLVKVVEVTPEEVNEEETTKEVNKEETPKAKPKKTKKK